MKRKRFAVMMAGVDREYQHELTKGMARAARAADVDLCIFNCQGQPDGFARDDQGERAIFDLPDLSMFDGAIALLATIPTKRCRTQIRGMLNRLPELPLVTIDARHGQSVQVGFDDVTSLRELMEHLLDVHGAKKFALVTGPQESPVARIRYETCLDVLEERGLTLPEEAIYDGRWVRDGGRKAVEYFSKRLKEMPDTIVCGNDDIAFGVYEELRLAGYRVPQDVKIVGFDARQEAIGCGLTTIRRPVMEAGELAVNTLLDWVKNGRPKTDEIELPTQIIYGDSCGCPVDPTKAVACVQMLSDERRLMERVLRQTTDFVTTLQSATTLREVRNELTEFTRAWQAQEMHVCVNPEFMNMETQRFPEHYPDEMLLLSGWSMGEESLQQRFEKRMLLPRMAVDRTAPMAVVFSPLSYMGSNLGYIVYDVEHIVSAVLPSLLLMMSSSLSSISLRATLQGYANVMERMSVHDELTGLHNRRGMQQLMPPMFEQAKREQKAFAVICCDMDNLKGVNDTYGHLAGDQAICRLGKAIRVLEKEGLLCIHISGDEFFALGILQREQTDEELLNRLRTSLRTMNEEEPWLCEVAASMGAYVAVPHEGDRMEEFILLADNKMYAEKHLHHRRIGRTPESDRHGM